MVTLGATAASSAATSSCPFDVGFMRLGSPDNKPADVARLQQFLRSQKLDVNVTGIFDDKTDAAVRSFQRAYMSDIMVPWGATRPSGIVNLTTVKKINQLVCGTPLSLDGNELAVLVAYQARAGSSSDQNGADGYLVTPETSLAAPVSSNSIVQGLTIVPNGTASAADAAGPSLPLGGGSMAQRFWDYLAGLFGVGR